MACDLPSMDRQLISTAGGLLPTTSMPKMVKRNHPKSPINEVSNLLDGGGDKKIATPTTKTPWPMSHGLADKPPTIHESPSDPFHHLQAFFRN